MSPVTVADSNSNSWALDAAPARWACQCACQPARTGHRRGPHQL